MSHLLHTTSARHSLQRPPKRRGVAMMLVLISLATATILTMAYVSSRDNSIEIGANVVDSATARWSAMSGLELGVAVLETETDWRTNHTNGMLLDDYVLGQATVDLMVEDIETSAPPTESTTAVRLTSVATVHGIAQTASATAQVTGGSDSGIDVDLSEFSIFTAGPVLIKDDATISRWPSAPKSALGNRIALGSQGLASGTVVLQDNAAALDTTIFLGAGASGTAVLNAGSPGLMTEVLLANIPMPLPPLPNVMTPEQTEELEMEFTNLSVDSSMMINADVRHEKIDIQKTNTILGLNGDLTVVAEDDFHLHSDTGVMVNGNVTLVVFDVLQLDNESFIEVMPNSSLTIYVGGDVSLDDAYIGNVRADRSRRDPSGAEPYMNPQRIMIFDFRSNDDEEEEEEEEVITNWTTKDITIVKATIYAPRMDMALRDDTAMYGRVAVNDLVMQNQAAIFYDHALDTGGGYTNPNSSLFNPDGTIPADVTNLASLRDDDLQGLADALSLSIETLFGLIKNPSGGGGSAPPDLGPGDPTPRTVIVTMNIDQHGTDPSNWESHADGAIVVKRNKQNNESTASVQTPGDFGLVTP